MKRDFRLPTSDFRLVAFAVGLCLVALAAGAATANPYAAIVGRNVFGLKPAPLNPPPGPPPAAAATIKLLGISTILDRRQVMLKVKTAARPAAQPPEPAKEQSYLMSQGQREDEIEVLEIDAAAGTVKIKNQDEILSLSMKDDAEKPAVGAVLPGPAVPPPLSSQPPGMVPPNPVQPVPGSGPRTIPTRSLRTGAMGVSGEGSAGSPRTLPSMGASPTQPDSSYQPPTSNLTADEQMAAMAVQQAAAQGTPTGAFFPPLPAKYRIQK